MSLSGTSSGAARSDPQVSLTWAAAGTVVFPIFLGMTNGTETAAVKMTTEPQAP